MMDTVFQILNKIKGHSSLLHRQFKNTLSQLENIPEEMFLYTKVRWMSKASCWARVFEIRNEK